MRGACSRSRSLTRADSVSAPWIREIDSRSFTAGRGRWYIRFRRDEDYPRGKLSRRAEAAEKHLRYVGCTTRRNDAATERPDHRSTAARRGFDHFDGK